MMVSLYGMILTTRARVGMIQQNYDIIDEVNCKVEAKQFAQFKKIICYKSQFKFSSYFTMLFVEG